MEERFKQQNQPALKQIRSSINKVKRIRNTTLQKKETTNKPYKVRVARLDTFFLVFIFNPVKNGIICNSLHYPSCNNVHNK